MSFALVRRTSLKSLLARKLAGFRYGISALDQMALSLFAFALNLCLVRALSATDFGVVSLWVAMAALANSVQAAMTSVPLNVHLQTAAADPARARPLEAAIRMVNAAAVASVAAIVILVILTVDADWAPRDIVGRLAIPIFLAAGMNREFSRARAFSRGDMAMVMWIDLPYLLVTSLGLAAMFAWPDWCANLAGAFIAMSVGCLVSQLCLRVRFRLPGPWPPEAGWLAAYRQIGRDVGWALTGVVASHLQTRCYVYVTVNLVSLAGLAAINVVGILFRPVRLLLHAWLRWVLPILSAALAAGQLRRFDRLFLHGFSATAIGCVVWFAVLFMAWPLVDRYFLAGHYPDAWSLVLPWAIAAALDGMAFTVSVSLQAAREFKFLAYAAIVSAPITLAATVAAVLTRGYTWTMYGVCVGEAVLLGLYLCRMAAVRRRVSREAGPEPAPVPATVEAGLGT